MRLLLDTHVALWAIAKRMRLPLLIREMIDDSTNDVIVSAVTIWEIAIKHALAKGGQDAIGVTGAEALAHFRDAGYDLLNVTPEHGAAVEFLPRLHSDPFDRLLVAQALSEPLRLVTHDAMVARYSDTVIHF